MSHNPVRRRPAEESLCGRSEAEALARREPERALAVARKIPDAWYRCQAMAWIARFAPNHVSDLAFHEAIAAAALGDDGYQRTAVLAWPIRAALERKWPELAEGCLHNALGQIPQVDPLASRASALDLLWAAAFPAGARLRGPIWQTVLAHCPAHRSWRAARLYRTIAAHLRYESDSEADKVTAALPAGKCRSRPEREKEHGVRCRPREFFW